jgi:hypothetical protein
MKNVYLVLLLQLVILAPLACQVLTGEVPRKVEIRESEDSYKLYVDDKEFYVNGAGCEFGDIKNLAEHGANTIRTWRIDNGIKTGKEILDEAQSNGLLVLMGLDVGRERHGFDYNNTVAVKQQMDRIRAQVLQYKDHPALLGWIIGNELNLGAKNVKVWDAVNDISKMIHTIDTNHPTTTALSGLRPGPVGEVKARCTDLDFLCFQMYGDVINIKKRLEDADWTGPYMVTEWGATGHWEVKKTEWGIPIEETSTEKATKILERWNNAIQANKTQCLGSFVFLWGQKQERTPTWYGFFLETGEETEATDVMQFAWTGKWPENRVPAIDSVLLNGKTRYDNIHLESSQKANVQIFAHDPDKDALSVICEIMPDKADNFRNGGDKEERPSTVYSKTLKKFKNKIAIETPAQPGPYRVFIYVFDGHNNAGTANVPFIVDEVK